MSVPDTASHCIAACAMPVPGHHRIPDITWQHTLCQCRTPPSAWVAPREGRNQVHYTACLVQTVQRVWLLAIDFAVSAATGAPPTSVVLNIA
eukprot:682452-Rhodomonas_salina.2